MRFACFLFFWVLSSELWGDDRRPNLLFMFTDDQPANCLGVMGNREILTPNLDSLAARGVVFSNAFATTAICCCNRACLLTGQHMMRHGIRDFITPLSESAFDQTYPALLRRAGYQTAFLGKYAIGNPNKASRSMSLPETKFDLWYGFDQSISFRQEVDGQTKYLTDVMTEKAITFLKTKPVDQPFCMTLAFKEPHGPFSYFDPNVPDPYESVALSRSPTCTEEDFQSQPDIIRSSLNADGYRSRLSLGPESQKEKQTAYRLISRADKAVGEILHALESLNLSNNTIVIFSSDHGSLLGDHGLTGKWLMYENSIRVPMIVFDPRAKNTIAGSRRDEMVLSIDIATTMLAAAGVPIPDGMQGKSMMPLVHGEKVDWRKHFYYEHTYQTDPPRSPIPKTEGIRTERWKYIRYPETSPVFEQLFDLEQDPLERQNLANKPEHAAELTRLRMMCDHERVALR
jgi:arylsulfatase A-like enzyme